jgi:hypothetical protein
MRSSCFGVIEQLVKSSAFDTIMVRTYRPAGRRLDKDVPVQDAATRNGKTSWGVKLIIGVHQGGELRDEAIPPDCTSYLMPARFAELRRCGPITPVPWRCAGFPWRNSGRRLFTRMSGNSSRNYSSRAPAIPCLSSPTAWNGGSGDSNRDA